MNPLALTGILGGGEIDMVPSPLQAARNPVSICGWLHKMKRRQRALTPAWVQRWFAIELGRLVWYRKKGMEAPNGFITLASVSSVEKFEGARQDGVHSFIVRSSERLLLLRAQNERDMDRWVSNIRLQMRIISGEPLEGAIPGSARSMGAKGGSRAGRKKDNYDHVLGQLEEALQQIEKLEGEVSLQQGEGKESSDEDDDDNNGRPESSARGAAPSLEGAHRSPGVRRASSKEAPGAEFDKEGRLDGEEKGYAEAAATAEAKSGRGSGASQGGYNDTPTRTRPSVNKPAAAAAPMRAQGDGRPTPQQSTGPRAPPPPKSDRVMARPQPPQRQGSSSSSVRRFDSSRSDRSPRGQTSRFNSLEDLEAADR